MDITSESVGHALPSRVAPVAPRDTANQAASLGDASPCYWDDERPDGLLAHPLFAAALTWPMVTGISDAGLPGIPTRCLWTLVHHTERLEFNRAIRPGDILDLTGRVASVVPQVRGSRIVLALTASDAEGRPVFTEYMGGLLRGVSLSDEGRSEPGLADSPPPPPSAGLWWESILDVDFLAPWVYDGCTGIHFPIHTSPAFARAVGLPQTIVQGTYILGRAISQILEKLADSDPDRLEILSCRFAGMILPDTRIRVQANAVRENPENTEIWFSVLNDDARPAIKDGYARVRKGLNPSQK